LVLKLKQTAGQRIIKICAVNVLGPSLLAAAAALPYLAVAKGTIINLSSTFGHKPVAGLLPLRRQQGGIGAPHSLLGAGTRLPWRAC